MVLSVAGLIHFHIIWFLPKYDGETFSDGLSLTPKLYDSIKSFWAENVGSLKKPFYQPLFTFQRKYYRGKLFTNYDTHFVVPSLTSSGYNSVAFYCCKYLFKVSDKETRLQQALRLNLPEDEYNAVWPIVKSGCYSSPSFGLGGSWNNLSIVNYIRDCVKRSDRSLGYPQFFNPDTAQAFPLAPFYKSRGYLCPQSVMDSFVHDSFIVDFNKNTTEIKSAMADYDRISQIVDKDLSINFNFLFE